MLLYAAEFQMEPHAPHATSYDTRPATYWTYYWLVQIRGSIILSQKAIQSKPTQCDAYPTEIQSEPLRVEICFDLYP